MAEAAAAGSSDGPSFEEQLFQVTLWLRKLYQDMPIPWYEVNEKTVDFLYEVKEGNEDRDKDVMLLIEDMKDRAAKYEAEADYWQDILRESLDFSEYSLSKEALADLNDLVESALELEVEDTSLASFYGAITSMTSELHKTKSKNNELDLQLKTLKKKLTLALMMEKKLKEDVEKLQESQEAERAKMEIRSENLKFLQVKTQDLKIKIREAENKLLDVGLDQSLTHEALMEASEELAALHKEMEPLKKELKSYNDLPLSMLLARVIVEEARNELKAVDEELTRELEAVPFELT
ncbi:HAUS augmin-like complex subunit 1 [Oenanthe melanoleuca]|uniref:HAUS augmin-like complex subunit 1 n=1 Tax=Oenanthe melanoleuca TaxID=2939378 RepID=UPI0024C19CB0|nr:HAUS augmin-like complex subunit 1 [Oenanthe melanoleuca]